MSRSARTDMPNVLFILSDQHRYATLPGVGNCAVVAPAMERLMHEGVNARNCYAVCPVCTPARGMLMSGRWPVFTGCVDNDCEPAPSRSSLGRCFQSAGYATAYIGKWHLHYGESTPDCNCRWIPPGPGRHGFESMTIWNESNQHWRGCWYDDATGERCENDGYNATTMTEQALARIHAQADDERPWFLWLSLNPPHPPLDDAPAGCLALYGDRELPLPPNVPEDWDAQRPVSPGAHKNHTGETMPFGEQVRQYHAHVTAIDREVGRLIERLEASGCLDNTLIVYTSDHGELLGSHGLLRKGRFYRESTQVPLLLRLPGAIAAGSVCDDLIAGLDIPATLLGLCGINVPPQMDGLDLSRRLRGLADGPKRRAVPHAMIGRNDPRARHARLGLRTVNRLYIAGAPEELYATDADPWEAHDLAADPAWQSELQNCRNLLNEELWK